jgi:hypothetical protein
MPSDMADLAEDDAFRGATGASSYAPIEVFSEGREHLAAHLTAAAVSCAVRTYIYVHFPGLRGHRAHSRWWIRGMPSEPFGNFIHVRHR